MRDVEGFRLASWVVGCNQYMKILALATTAALLTGAALYAQDKPIKLAAMPAAVQKTINDQIAHGATVRGLLTDRENGKTEYEAELTINGKHRDLAMNAAGKILEAEDAVSIDEVPAAAAAALRKAGTVVSVEAVSVNGKLEAYEAVVKDSKGKKHEARVTPAGKPAPENG